MMIDLPIPERRFRLRTAYRTLRQSIYNDRELSRMEWERDCCRYPLRGYFRQRMYDNIKAAFLLRHILRNLRGSYWDDATINLGVGKYPFSK